MLSGIDYIVIAIYGVLMVGIAAIAKQRSATVDDYFAAGHKLPWWMAAISHHVSGYSAVVFVGFAGKAASAGLSMWTLFALPTFIAMMVGCFVWAPRWARLKVLTPVEYLERRYNNAVRVVVALAGIGVKFIDLGIKLYAISSVVQVCTGWNLVPIIIGAGIVTIVYVMIGGLWATVLTDLVQFVVQLVLSALVVGAVLLALGGWSSMWSQLPPERYEFLNPSQGIDLEFWLIYLLVIILSYNGATWGLAQRFIAVGKARDTQKAALLSGILFLFYPIVIFIPAWAAPLVMPEQFDPTTLLPLADYDPQQTYVLVARQFLDGLSPGLIGLLVCSMFAATMSMIDSDINALAAVFTKDIFQRNFGAQASEAVLGRVAVYATVGFGLAVLATALGVAASEGVNKVFSQTVKLYGAILAPIAIPLMFGMLWRRPSARGALASLIVGFCITLYLKSAHPDSFVIYTGGGMLASLVIFFGDGFLSRRSAAKEQEIDALFAQVNSD